MIEGLERGIREREGLLEKGLWQKKLKLPSTTVWWMHSGCKGVLLRKPLQHNVVYSLFVLLTNSRVMLINVLVHM